MRHFTVIAFTILVLSGCQRESPQADSGQLSPRIAQAALDFQSEPGARYRDDYAVPRMLLPLLEPGLSQQEVEALLGEPDTIHMTDDTVSWSYTLFYSMFIEVRFDEGDELVEVQSPLLEELEYCGEWER